MKRNGFKETDSSDPAEKALEMRPPENLLVFLIFAIVLLAATTFASGHPILRQSLSQHGNIHDRYLWLDGSFAIKEGLYRLSPAELENSFPALLSLWAQESSALTTPPVSAVTAESGKPRIVHLPPNIANVFFQPISINRADENILLSLPGIGPVLAKNIVRARKEHGPFRSKQELLQVTGIGPKKLAALTDHITFD